MRTTIKHVSEFEIIVRCLHCEKVLDYEIMGDTFSGLEVYVEECKDCKEK